MQRSRLTTLTALLAVLTASACAPDSRGPVEPPAAPAASLSALASIHNVQLRALPPNPIYPTDPVYGWGHVQLQTGYPGDPIVPDGFALVSVKGRIFNEGGAVYAGGGLYKGSLGTGEVGGPELIASFGNAGDSPPICRRYDLGGAILIADAVAAEIVATPASYRVLLHGLVGEQSTFIGGLLDGSAWGPVGERSGSDPIFAEDACSVSITP